MNESPFALVIVAFNRPASLNRLLVSLKRINTSHSGRVPLIISIDFGGPSEVRQIADAFEWPFGEKTVVAHSERMGLKKHVMWCGDLCERFGAVIVLEDDLIVAPNLLELATQLHKKYGENPDVCQCALYTPSVNESCGLPFVPIDDGYDVFFAKVPCSWGQLWSRQQWRCFKDYLSRRKDDHSFEGILPEAIKDWPRDTSWKRDYYAYCIENELYIVYPRVGATSNCGDKGTHYTLSTVIHQAKVCCMSGSLRLPDLAESRALYDEYFEIEAECLKKLQPTLQNYDFAVDLQGSRPILSISDPFILTTRTSYNPQVTFGNLVYPKEMNVALGIYGNDIFLVEKKNIVGERKDRFLSICRSAPTKFAVESLTNSPRLVLDQMPTKLFIRCIASAIRFRIMRLLRDLKERFF